MTSVVEVLHRQTSMYPASRAVTFLLDSEEEEGQWTFAELDRRAREVAVLIQAQAAPGDRVLLLYAAGLSYVEAFFGCMYAGVVAVPVYPPDPTRLQRTVPRLQAIAKDARATCVLTTTAILELAEFAFQGAPDLQALRWLATDVDRPSAAERIFPGLDGSAVAFLQYTSGSTGSPKGVMVTHANLLDHSLLIKRAAALDENSVGVSWLPLYHDMGLIGMLLSCVHLRMPLVLMSPTAFLRKPGSWLRAITKYRGTLSGAPNFAFDLCARKVTEEEKGRLDLSSWSVAFNGAEPLRLETLDRFEAAFASCGFRRSALFPCYGLAEASLMVSGGPFGDGIRVVDVDTMLLRANRVGVSSAGDARSKTRLVSSGLVRPEQRLVIVDPDTRRPCAADRIGEIWVSGTSVAAGYWDKPDGSTETFRARLDGEADDFLRTGDLGFIRDGFLYITGRSKDLIIIRGANHYPQDVERTVEQVHRALRPGCGAAFSVDIDGEERLVVVQELDPRQLESGAEKSRLDDLMSSVRERISADHQLPVHALTLVEAGSIAKTSSGKIQRRACRSAFLDGGLSVVASWQAAARSTSTPRAHEKSVERPRDVEELQRQVCQMIAQLVGKDAEQIDIHKPISTNGLDSVGAVEMQASLEAMGFQVSMAVFLDDGTIAQLAEDAWAAHQRQQSAPDVG